MANLSAREKSTFEELFEMSGGYVIDFSNNTFASFVGDTVNIDVYNGTGYTEYTSKANKLRQIWSQEPDAVVGMLNQALLERVEDRELRLEQMTDYKRKKIGEMTVVCQRLLGNAITVDLPKKQEDTLLILLDDINNSLARNQPTLVLDRLHTYSTKLLRGICQENGITVTAPNGDFLPLHSLAGLLKKHYAQNPLFQSTFTIQAIQTSISLFDSYNAIRNNKSYAHDNDVLDALEATFAVKTMANLVAFIDAVEAYRKKAEESERKNDWFNGMSEDDLPF